jgi:tetratricopeptide (TPR) repeat protein
MKRRRDYAGTPRGGDSFRQEDLFDNPIEFEIDFYEGVLQGDPNNVEILSLLGNLYTQAGMYEKGLQIDQRLVKMRPDDALVHYNLACSYSLLNRIGEALDELEKAVDLGYNDYIHLRSDSDLDKIRGEQRFKALVKRLLQKIQ